MKARSRPSLVKGERIVMVAAARYADRASAGSPIMSCFRPFIVAIAITLFVGAPTANAQRRSGGSVRGGSSAPRVSGGARVTGGGGRIVGGGRVFGAPARYYQPYYMFRPRVSVGFGLWAGFAI